ncbi:phage/plasmid replication protein, II/X family [Gallaecimonas pentaromativorans]|uniref:II/X family phage/plasmid replication protein n=1 Tax=Gallaecimonas pentaromativorans TaxID=584787 RepID=A0A3N1P6G0_9GAMM|nr:phage/plasmid replication protein, II/X family [Gallaecimonas pentaromativorans]ROQ27584.1 II/X family phage/plasmid replication protein [Gallaecimonas pentaromativorans]
MLDWVDAVIHCRHRPIVGGRFIRIDEFGSVVKDAPTFSTIRGSHDAGVCVRSGGYLENGMATQLYLSGNPNKFLTGHNIVGSDDICALVTETVARIFESVGETLDETARARLLAGRFDLKRVDINYMLELPSHSDVEAFLKALTVKCRSRHGVAQAKGQTVYFGLGSRRWLLKFYSKFLEITSGRKGHTLPDEFLSTPLFDFTTNKVRAELQIRKLELCRFFNTDNPQGFHLTDPYLLWRDYMSRLNMQGNLALRQEDEFHLPAKLQAPYLLWKQGRHLRDVFSKATFYRHRKELLEYGIDISMPYEGITPASNVIPLVRVLEAKPVAIPTNLQAYCF